MEWLGQKSFIAWRFSQVLKKEPPNIIEAIFNSIDGNMISRVFNGPELNPHPHLRAKAQ
jgi:hypothetical protein